LTPEREITNVDLTYLEYSCILTVAKTPCVTIPAAELERLDQCAKFHAAFKAHPLLFASAMAITENGCKKATRIYAASLFWSK